MPQVYTAIITPFQEDGEIDYDLMDELMTWQRRVGIDGLVVCGTNGEFSSLSFEEVKSLLKFASDRRMGGFEIIAGTGRASLKETIALCNFVEELTDKTYPRPLDSSSVQTDRIALARVAGTIGYQSEARPASHRESSPE